MSICLFGGTFNPIHNGHINMISKALDTLNPEKLYVIPAGNSYFKNNVLNSEDRANMVKLAIESLNDERIIYSNIELLREGPSYSIDTIEYYSNLYPDETIDFVVGEDSVYKMPIWYRIADIFANVHLVVFKRNSQGKLEEFLNELSLKYSFKYTIIEYDYDISSSYIRENINSNTSVKEHLPDTVYDYIIKNGLYKNAD